MLGDIRLLYRDSVLAVYTDVKASMCKNVLYELKFYFLHRESFPPNYKEIEPFSFSCTQHKMQNKPRYHPPSILSYLITQI